MYVISGLVAGLVAKTVTVLDRKLLFKDSTFFDVPEDFKTNEGDDDAPESEDDDEKEAAV